MTVPIVVDPETLPIPPVHDVYPGIDPTKLRNDQFYKGRVVLVTGASRGIGREIAFEYARCGATLALVARKEDTLEVVKAEILKEVPKATIGLYVCDVSDVLAVEAAVKAVVATFGRLDIAVANAGQRGVCDTVMNSDPFAWWSTFEVNLRGTYNLAHFAMPELIKTEGYFVIMSSVVAQMRYPCNSDYTTAKHALNRLNEYIHMENPTVKSFSLNPGAILTEMTEPFTAIRDSLIDTVQLAACTILRLTSGREDWLSGKYISANWDLDEVQKDWKEKILQEDALVNRLHIPRV